LKAKDASFFFYLSKRGGGEFSYVHWVMGGFFVSWHTFVLV
jgi:hypothetical protein